MKRRYDVKHLTESEADVRTRIIAAASDAGEWIRAGANGRGWMLGEQYRGQGFRHSDIWRGSTADVASKARIGSYHALGWGKIRPWPARLYQTAPYALELAISEPRVAVELYSAIANQIAGPAAAVQI